jgi:hypothetical protein
VAAAEQTEQQEALSDRHQALVTATAALAGAAATYTLRKALKRDNPEGDELNDRAEASDPKDGQPESGEESAQVDEEETEDPEILEGEPQDEPEGDNGPQETNETVSGAAAAGAWQSASRVLVPLAEHAAEAAGRWTAKHSPALLRDHLIPRLIHAFDEAS